MPERDDEIGRITKMLEADAFRREGATLSRSQAARLVCLAGPDVGRVFLLDIVPAVIGRDVGVDLRLADDRASRRHARIAREDDALLIEDLDSSNGMLVNGAKKKIHLLAHGDRIQLGGTLLVYSFEEIER